MKERNLIILGILVVLTAAAVGFIFLKNNPPEQELTSPCVNVEGPETGMRCEDALIKALALYPGNVNSIQLTTTKFQEGPTGTPRDIAIWLVDIDLENPIETEAGIMERVTVGIDITSAIEPFIQEFFPAAL